MQIIILAVLTNDTRDADSVRRKLNEAGDTIVQVHPNKSEAIVIQYDGDLAGVWAKLRQSVTSLTPKQAGR